MSFFDDLASFGSGLLEDIGEGAGNLISGYTQEQSTNPNLVQQPSTTVADNHGNAVTQPQGATTEQPQSSLIAGISNTHLAIGGAVGAVVLLLLLLPRARG